MKLQHVVYKGIEIDELISGWFSAIINGEYYKRETLNQIKSLIDSLS